VNKRLLYACRNCGHQEIASHPRIYRNEIKHSFEEQTIVFQDIASDPTLPRASARCGKCGHREAVFFQSTATGRDEAMTLYFVCCNPTCGHKWKE